MKPEMRVTLGIEKQGRPPRSTTVASGMSKVAEHDAETNPANTQAIDKSVCARATMLRMLIPPSPPPPPTETTSDAGRSSRVSLASTLTR